MKKTFNKGVFSNFFSHTQKVTWHERKDKEIVHKKMLYKTFIQDFINPSEFSENRCLLQGPKKRRKNTRKRPKKTCSW